MCKKRKKKQVKTVKRETLFLYLATYAFASVGINSKRYFGDWFLIALKKKQRFL